MQTRSLQGGWCRYTSSISRPLVPFTHFRLELAEDTESLTGKTAGSFWHRYVGEMLLGERNTWGAVWRSLGASS